MERIVVKFGDNQIATGIYQGSDYSTYDFESTEDPPQLNPDEIVITRAEIKIAYTYPLSKPVTLTHVAPNTNGFTRKELVEQIQANYIRIYNEESATIEKPATNIPGWYNREETDGKYGIWGHCIEDLSLMNLYLREGDTVYEMSIDS
jgi:hypothetical protein